MILAQASACAFGVIRLTAQSSLTGIPLKHNSGRNSSRFSSGYVLCQVVWYNII